MSLHSKWSSGDLIFYDGAQDILTIKDGTDGVVIGEDDYGVDFKAFGATSGKYMLWDASADKFIVVGSADLGTACEADAYTVGGTAGADFSGAVTNLTVVKGIVTAAS